MINKVRIIILILLIIFSSGCFRNTNGIKDLNSRNNFVAYDGKDYYFSNEYFNYEEIPNEYGKMYKTDKNLEEYDKVINEFAKNIKIYKNYIYFIDLNGFLQRLDKNTKDKNIIISDPVKYYKIVDGHVYYILELVPGLWKAKLDGSESKPYIQDLVNNFYIDNGEVYYTTNNGIYRYNGDTELIHNAYAESILVDDTIVYYHRYLSDLMALDINTGNAELLAKDVITFNISNEYIYYSIDTGLYRINIDTKTTECIISTEDSIRRIDVFEDKLFFSIGLSPRTDENDRRYLFDLLYSSDMDGSNFTELTYGIEPNAFQRYVYEDQGIEVSFPVYWSVWYTGFTSPFTYAEISSAKDDIQFNVGTYKNLSLYVSEEFAKMQMKSLITSQGYEGLYGIEKDDERFRVLFYFIKDDNTYFTEFSGDINLYGKYENIIIDVINSFKVLKQNIRQKPEEPELKEYGEYTYEVIDNGVNVKINKYNGSDENIVIPEMIDSKSVTVIDIFAFLSIKSIKSIVVPDSIKTIEGYAFYYNSNLSEIYIPDSVTYIGENAFSLTDEKLVIFGDKGSFAEHYAACYDIPFEYLKTNFNDFLIFYLSFSGVIILLSGIGILIFWRAKKKRRKNE